MAATSSSFMDITDVRTIEQVFAEIDVSVKLRIDIKEITQSLRRLNYIDDCLYGRLREIDTRTSGNDSGFEVRRLIKFNKFLWEIVEFISFKQFLNVLCDLGSEGRAVSLELERKRSAFEEVPSINQEQCTKIGTENIDETSYQPYTDYTMDEKFPPIIEQGVSKYNRYEIPRTVSKFLLPHSEHLSQFYIELKIRVDNNTLQNGINAGNRQCLEIMISNLDGMINLCDGPRRKQLLIDKRVILYFLLNQQYAVFSERLNILKRLHDSMPQGADRTMFKAVYHSNMAVSWALAGNERTALEHVAVSREDSFLCSPCLPVFISLMGSHISHSEVYLYHTCEDYLHRALSDFENVSQLVQEASEDEQAVWKSGTLLIMASALLGIQFFSKVCDDSVCPDIENIEKARHILAAARQLKSLPKHRELMLYLCMGKLHDIDGNKTNAVKFIRKARELADSCSSNNTEKSNISAYLYRLESQIC